MTSQELCLCTKCKEMKPKTTHHVLPRCHFKKSRRISRRIKHLKVILCWECHWEIEILLREQEGNEKKRKKRLTPYAYISITEQWLGRQLNPLA